MQVCMIGTGYVGLVSGACFAEMGNDVWCVDIDEEKIEGLRQGQIPIYEPGLEDMIKRNVRQGRLHFTSDLHKALNDSLLVFIAVGTPQDEDGSADLASVLAVAKDIGKFMTDYKVIVTKSTVPVGTAEKVRQAISEELHLRGSKELIFDVVSCPEFLKEGSAIEDFMRPDRIIIGVESDYAARLMRELFAPFVRNNHPIYIISIPSAELTKYAANAMLATRISFMNEIALLCERTGADIEEIRLGIGSDSRIGKAFLYAGIGYGGSCFPKDIKALVQMGWQNGLRLSILQAVDSVNQGQKQRLVDMIIDHFDGYISDKTIAIWGLSFKPHTDDMREAPSSELINGLRGLGASIQAYDPVAVPRAKHIYKNDPKIIFFDDNYEVLKGANALVLVTEWPQFRHPDFQRIKGLLAEPVIFDGRNQYDPDRLKDLGFNYYCIGRAWRESAKCLTVKAS